MAAKLDLQPHRATLECEGCRQRNYALAWPYSSSCSPRAAAAVPAVSLLAKLPHPWGTEDRGMCVLVLKKKKKVFLAITTVCVAGLLCSNFRFTWELKRSISCKVTDKTKLSCSNRYPSVSLKRNLSISSQPLSLLSWDDGKLIVCLNIKLLSASMCSSAKMCFKWLGNYNSSEHCPSPFTCYPFESLDNHEEEFILVLKIILNF